MAEVERPRRFRILIIGRANAGKTTILRAVCGVDEEPDVYDREGNKITPVVDTHHPVHGEVNQATVISTRSTFRSAWRSIYARLLCRPPASILTAHPGEPEELNLAPSPPPRREPKSILSPSSLRGEHHIDYELRFPSNPGFVFHDSRGFESGAAEELELVRKFIQEQASLGSMSEQLHAIWYCFPADSNRLMTAAEKEFFNKIDTGTVPVVAVFTKFDALDSAAFTAVSGPGVPFEVAKEMASQHATEKFNAEVVPLIEGLAHPPKAVVCLRNMHDRKIPAVIQKAASELVERTEAALDTDVLRKLLVQAQCVNVELCMKGAVKSETMRAAQVNPNAYNPLQKKVIRDIFGWFPSIWVRATDTFINALTPWFSPLAPSMAPQLQVLFVGISMYNSLSLFTLLTLFLAAVIIAADSFWPSSDRHGGQSITTSITQYFQSNRADHVRMAILDALHHDKSSLEESLIQIALNNHLVSAGFGSIALS
ncbi:hypothetical protein BOTBODRAFT_28693 [Botryobasidium botryosum FD-172 SS1]|uniref:G domain-containing protein n=1 Tax=Botryobasidium botryosum (strain FD-172 SS1) TaxID=930990 RepID=A0A067MRD3_BOTB1|nr:hypothetical protein BOTBODRAFT_28693 [Botryobasidium botryosum FD-172 SS1]